MQWNLIRLRKENNYSQEDLAKILGVTDSTYRNKETGKTQFKMDEMFILANLFDGDMEDIFLPTNFTVRDKNRKEGIK